MKCAVEDVIHGDPLVPGYDAFSFFVGQSGKETYHPRERQKCSQGEEEPPDRWKFLRIAIIDPVHASSLEHTFRPPT
jgi:hypothetical protein